MGKHKVDISETMLVAVFSLFFLMKTSDVVFSRQFVRESETKQMLFFSKIESIFFLCHLE